MCTNIKLLDPIVYSQTKTHTYHNKMNLRQQIACDRLSLF